MTEYVPGRRLSALCQGCGWDCLNLGHGGWESHVGIFTKCGIQKSAWITLYPLTTDKLGSTFTPWFVQSPVASPGLL